MAASFRRSATISLTGMIVPFALGTACSYFMYNNLLKDDSISFSSFAVFLGVAMSITAFPVLARILVDQKLLNTKVGVITISAAAVDDIIAWSLLALVICLLSAGKDMLAALWVFLTLMAWSCFLLFVFRPLYGRFVMYMTKKESRKGLLLACTFCFIFISAYFTEMLGVHAVFGGFLMGLTMPHGSDFSIKLTQKIEDFNGTVWLPLYFTYSGLRTNIKSLDSGVSWAAFFMVLGAATAGKFGGCTLAAKIQKANWREAATVGVLMNTKGLVELVVLNLGLDVGVINVQIFTVMVMMALTTTIITTPVVNKIYPLKFRTDYVEDDKHEHATEKEMQELNPRDSVPNDNESPQERKERRESLSKKVPTHPEAAVVSVRPDEHDLLRICIPFHSSDEAAVIASIMGLFGSSAIPTKIGALRLLELSDSYLRDNLLSMNRNEDEIHEQSVKHDSVLRMVTLFSRLVPSIQIRCGVRISHASDFGQDVSEFARKFNSDIVMVPLFREKDSLEIAADLNEADHTQFILEVANHCKKVVGLFLDGKTKIQQGVPGKAFRDRICVVFRMEEDGFELLSIARRFVGRPHTKVDVLLLGNIEAYPIIQEDVAVGGEPLPGSKNSVRSALEKLKNTAQGESSSIEFREIAESDDFKSISTFLDAENDSFPFTLVVVGGDANLPLGFVSTTTLFGAMGSSLIENSKIECAVMTILQPREDPIEHVTQSKGNLTNFFAGDAVVITANTSTQAAPEDGAMPHGSKSRMRLSGILHPDAHQQLEENKSTL
eukprot:TRINITY_DN14880_c0_g1_i2.p1 TRINITY_DN14880_c0_g1~~TRINITY_DN14880_c0_g1_i2.p1  ORF type:complete len:882 (+),score=242.98 TRINITY_DN14880_c0_g1_i2:316-2646(+)